LESSPSLIEAAPIQTPKKGQIFFSLFKTTHSMGCDIAKEGEYILMDIGSFGRIKPIMDYY
jgi:hypothetical protein